MNNPVSGHEWSSDVLEWWPLSEMGLKLYTEVDGDFRDECEVMGRMIEKKVKRSAEQNFDGTESESLNRLVTSYHALCWPSRFSEIEETLK